MIILVLLILITVCAVVFTSMLIFNRNTRNYRENIIISASKRHSFRVAKYTEMLARELGCDDETAENYHNIALMHDIGKIGIPDDVLNKPGKLTEEV